MSEKSTLIGHLAGVCLAAVAAGAAFADTYTWTGSASAAWNKTDANWDKGVWVDGNVARFPAGASLTNITLEADVSVSDILIDSGNWSLGGAHTLTISKTGGANACLSQTSSASLTLKDGITVTMAKSCENNLNVLNIENATFEAPNTRFHNGWNNGNGIPGGATINVGDKGVLTVYEFVPSGSTSEADASLYRVNVTTGGVFRLSHVLTQYSIDITRYSTLYFDGGTLEGYVDSYCSMFTRPSATKIKLGPGGMRIGGDKNIYLRTPIEPSANADGGILLDTTKIVYFYHQHDGLPESTFTGPVRLNKNGVFVFNGDRNFGAVPSSPTNGIVFSANSRLLSHGHIVLHPNRNILIHSNAVAKISAETFSGVRYSLAIKGTVSGDSPGCDRNGTLSTESDWTGDLSLLPPEGRTNSIGRLLVKKQDLTIGGEGVTEITDRLNDLSSVGNNGALAVMGGATLNVTNGLVRVWTNHYTIVENGKLNVSGGVLDLSRQRMFVNAHDGVATTVVSRTGTMIVRKFCLSLRSPDPQGGLTRLESGGVLALDDFYMDASDGTVKDRGRIDFDGGIVAPRVANRGFLGGTSRSWITNTLCMVREGGAVISNNVEVWTHHPFFSGAEHDGGLHKWGTGPLALITTENTFNGPIEIHQGTLVWGNSSNYFPTARLVVHEGGTANLNTYTQKLARVEGGGAVKTCNGLTVDGAVAPGLGADAPGNLKFQDRCIFDDCLLEIDPGDKLTVCDGQDIGELSLHVNDLSALDKETVYTVLDVASNGDFTGQFKSDNVQSCSAWQIWYDHVKHRVFLKYARGTQIIFR